MTGVYKWRVVADSAIVAHDLGNKRKVIAAPQAEHEHHRVATVTTHWKVGTVGQLRYVSNFPHWGRLEFERT